MKRSSTKVEVGTCGFCMPQKDYFRCFKLIEIQQTFYQPPQPKTVERWRREAPEDFIFTLKAFQAVTHPGTSPTFRRCKMLSNEEKTECGFFRDNSTVRKAWWLTFELAQILKAACVVFQCPAGFRPTDEHLNNMKCFFNWAERGSLIFCWEPRGAEWTEQLVEELCQELELVRVVDPLWETVTDQFVYFRLHGSRDSKGRIVYSHHYSESELLRLAKICSNRRGYVLFNNSAMKEDAVRFLHIQETLSQENSQKNS